MSDFANITYRIPKDKFSREGLNHSGIATKFIDLDCSAIYDKSVRKKVSYLCENIGEFVDDAEVMLISGNNGAGKSLIGSLITMEAKKIIGLKACMTLYDSLINMQLSKEEERRYKAEKLIEEYDLLVIDELGKEVNTKSDFNKSFIENIVKKREMLGHATIILTNLDIGSLKSRYGTSFIDIFNEHVIMELVVSESGRKNTKKSKLCEVLNEEM
jgi:DNA replication protein DnaC